MTAFRFGAWCGTPRRLGVPHPTPPPQPCHTLRSADLTLRRRAGSSSLPTSPPSWDGCSSMLETPTRQSASITPQCSASVLCDMLFASVPALAMVASSCCQSRHLRCTSHGTSRSVSGLHYCAQPLNGESGCGRGSPSRDCFSPSGLRPLRSVCGMTAFRFGVECGTHRRLGVPHPTPPPPPCHTLRSAVFALLALLRCAD